MRSVIRILRRGHVISIGGAQARMTLLDWLRLEQRLTGTKEGCAEGDCGACTVVLARLKGGRIVHEPVNACILLVGQCDGAEVIAVEDLAPGGTLHPVQDAMWRHHGSQCGFCTPGIVMSLYALQHAGPRPATRAAVCDQLAGNLCRCTGYRPIIDAALEACAQPPHERPHAATPAILAPLDDEADVLIGDDTAFFAAPRTEAALARLLAKFPGATIVAGSTDAGLWFTKQLVEPRQIVWLGRVRGLGEIAKSGSDPQGLGSDPQGPKSGSDPQGLGSDPQGLTPNLTPTLAIGATATLADAAAHLGALAPDLAEIIRRFGSTQVRASATVGGNIANGSPIGDLAPCLIALGATLELAGTTGTRTLPLEDFFVAYKTQDRRPGEYVRRILVPVPGGNVQFRAYKLSKRMDEDISAVLGAFAFVLEGRRIASARLAFGGMAGTPARARTTEALLAGLDLDDPKGWAQAIGALTQEFTPLTDHRASAEYRRTAAGNLLAKALAEIAGAPASSLRIEPALEAIHAGR